jgi:hypothetical protein
MLVLLVLTIAGCATDPAGELSGRHAKNGSPVPVERLGSVTSSALPTELQCGSKQVMWCAGGRVRSACQCVQIREAQDRVRRFAAQRNTSLFRNP